VTREALAEELSNLAKRYRYSVRALEVFVNHSLEGIDRNRPEALKMAEKINSALRGDEPAVEPEQETFSIIFREIKSN
jgi:hypothetical protein